jgi:HAD superfamily hydrolase (TIGR01459 family)
MARSTHSRVIASLQAQLQDLRAQNFRLRFMGVRRGVEELVDQYDGFILDQWGVLHNGKVAYSGVSDCLSELHRRGKKLIILSNSSRRKDATLATLPSIGIDKSLIMSAVTSGEQAFKVISKKYAKKKCLLLGWDDSADKSRSVPYFETLGIILAEASEADFVLAHGTQLIKTGKESIVTELYSQGEEALSLYERHFRIAVARDLPMVCANPDFIAIDAGGKRWVTGTLARRYEELGGRVSYHGKPHREHFEDCIEELGVARERIVHVGDSLHHDIKGANAVGIDSIFVSSTGVSTIHVLKCVRCVPAQWEIIRLSFARRRYSLADTHTMCVLADTHTMCVLSDTHALCVPRVSTVRS